MPSRSSVAAPLLLVLLAGCEAPDPAWFGEERPEPDGEFFAWELDPRDPAFDDWWVRAPNRVGVLAAGATLHVGYSPTGYLFPCVESLVPQVAASDCGEIVGVAEGWTQLVEQTEAERVIDYRPLQVREPTALDVSVVRRYRIGASHVTLTVPTYPGQPVRVPFTADLQVLVLPRDAIGPLVGVVPAAAEVRPAEALALESYGRYFRIVCLWTGLAGVRFSFRGAWTVLPLDCLEPGDGEEAP